MRGAWHVVELGNVHSWRSDPRRRRRGDPEQRRLSGPRQRDADLCLGRVSATRSQLTHPQL